MTFGAPGYDHVPISMAIEASSALPGLFPPVMIGGEHYVDGALNKTLHASVALDEGVDLLLCVNPLVPFDASRAAQERPAHRRAKLNEGGLPIVLSQTFRAIIHSRMKVGMEKYRRQYPHADVVLFEPDREDADMFFASIFSYSQRKRLCAAAYAEDAPEPRRRAPTSLAPQLARHGITLRHDRLADAARRDRPTRSPIRGRCTRSRAPACAARRAISRTRSNQLERWLAPTAGSHGHVDVVAGSDPRSTHAGGVVVRNLDADVRLALVRIRARSAARRCSSLAWWQRDALPPPEQPRPGAAGPSRAADADRRRRRSGRPSAASTTRCGRSTRTISTGSSSASTTPTRGGTGFTRPGTTSSTSPTSA